ncbi:MAG: S24/S26 family peptidase [Bdellovibrionales bacterium]
MVHAMEKLSPKRISEVKNILDTHDVVEMTVVSNSMEPLIATGEKILVSSLLRLKRPLRPFDVVLFVKDQLLICHYIQHLNALPGPDGRRFIITRGLSTPGEDLPVYENDVLGLVVSHSINWVLRVKVLYRSWRDR